MLVFCASARWVIPISEGEMGGMGDPLWGSVDFPNRLVEAQPYGTAALLNCCSQQLGRPLRSIQATRRVARLIEILSADLYKSGSVDKALKCHPFVGGSNAEKQHF